MIHSGSVIAAGISQGRSTSLKRDFKVSPSLVHIRRRRGPAMSLGKRGLSCTTQVCCAGTALDIEAEGQGSVLSGVCPGT